MRNSAHYNHEQLRAIAIDTRARVYGHNKWNERRGLQDYIANIRLVLQVPRGGCVLFIEDGAAWYIDGFANGYVFKPTTMRAILLICGRLGASVVYANVTLAPKMGRYWKMVGMGKIGENLYSARIENGT